jgi:hypothetical protein
MAAPRSTAAHASVVFLKIPEYSQQPVAEQVRLKDRLEGVVTAALAAVDPGARIVLEAPDGAAIVVLGDPEAALGLAQRSSVGGSMPVAVGLSHGPVRVAGGDTTPIVLGDALAVAEAVSGLSTPGRVAATREFREALKRTAPGLARFLAPAGTHTDSRDRSYEVFLADREAAEKRRRRWLGTLAASFIAIVAAGIAVRTLREEPPAPAAPVAASKAVQKPVEPALPPKAPTESAARALATVRLEIKPRGEVFIDGVAKGTSPPLASLQVPPGKHTIEVRHGRSRPLSLDVDAGPGEELVIRHTFSVPPATKAEPKPVWQRWYDQAKGVFK